ncbi:uncharacterized protein CCOS01_11440 [Colletotrichum costaricense]|uniref:Xylanolytic transcriptional activator regulatory domain-containing protein n=1 Tax=Colletotrichum costaricense TaxID=1209916 RepID=A0AAI9YP11_9PEZI|nr:uncharacterized protein CCOS01_11440 [Colletotrichum costaricense]KAK1518620.1 hypothetical protein CCOS01_11440 [Colletotrichum costaricense]
MSFMMHASDNADSYYLDIRDRATRIESFGALGEIHVNGVPVNRIKSLESQLRAAQDRPADGSPLGNEEQAREESPMRLPEAEPPGSIKIRRYGHAAYLGHSSTLSFSRNVRNLLQSSTPIADPGSVSIEREDVSYTSPLPPLALDLTKVPLPQLSYAEYLTNTIVLTFGSLYSLFDAEAFLEKLRMFYSERATGTVPNPCLWHIQMLLVLGLGKSILSREHSQSGPAGMVYFASAIEAMSDIRRLYQSPFLSMEILSLTALFMHATDMLQEAYVTIMNVSMPEALRPPNVEYQRRLWWTVYCIDRKTAAMLGSTMVVRDDDISIPFPETKAGDEVQNIFAIHVTLSSHLGRILDVIYGVHNQKQRNFVTQVREILERLVQTLVVLREHLDLDLDAPSQPLTRDAATLHLLLHQVRESTKHSRVMTLIRGTSAIQILKIMAALKQQMMCDALFSAAFALVLIDIIRPANELLWDLPQAIHLLDEYVSRHVAPAQAYRSDLLQLVELHTKLRGSGDIADAHRQDEGQEAESNARHTPNMVRNAIANADPSGASGSPVWSQVRPGNDGSAPTNLETMMSVIDDLNVHESDIIDAAMLEGGWMWEDDNMWTAA